MKISSPKQLKDWINNLAKKNKMMAGTILQNFMMERLLERISSSKYKDNFILKDGFLIAAMVGLDMRSTMDMDTTIKGIPVNQENLETMLNEIFSINLDDNVTFKLKNIRSIHDVSEYDDFRVSLEAQFFTIKVNMKLDVTTGDVIIPREIVYPFKLMFEEREISIKAYNLNTILAEKVESILVRNVSNTRARDYYDVYILLTLRRAEIDMISLRNAIQEKADERNTTMYIEHYGKYLSDIEGSEDLKEIWSTYKLKYPYAKDIQFYEITKVLREIFTA